MSVRRQRHRRLSSCGIPDASFASGRHLPREFRKMSHNARGNGMLGCPVANGKCRPYLLSFDDNAFRRIFSRDVLQSGQEFVPPSIFVNEMMGYLLHHNYGGPVEL